MSTKLNELVSMHKAIKARFKNEGQEAVKEHFQELFKEIPELTTVTWRQWTPGFNDGDPCYNILGSYQLFFSSAQFIKDNTDWWYLEENPDITDEELIEASKMQYDEEGISTECFKKSPIKTTLDKYFSTFHECDDIFEDIFGTNKEITITRKGITTEWYDCGY